MGSALKTEWASLRQLSKEHGVSHSYFHNLHQRGFLAAVECQRFGPRGWFRLRRGEALDFVVRSLLADRGKRPRMKDKPTSLAYAREFLAAVADGRREVSDLDRKMAVSFLRLALAASVESGGEPLRLTLASLQHIASALRAKRVGTDPVNRSLAGLCACLEPAPDSGNSTTPPGQ